MERTIIYCSAVRSRLVDELRRTLAEIEAAEEGGLAEATIYGEPDMDNEDGWRLVFTNDDMEGRPEMANRFLIDVEQV